MKRLKEKWLDLLVTVVCIVAAILIDNRNFRIIAVVVGIFCIYDFFSKEPVKKEKEDKDKDVLSDEEMEDELLGEGEYSYDNYDEVCCPKCGAYLGKGKTTCDVCGYGKQKYEEVCPECGKRNEDDLDTCAYCNHPLKLNVYNNSVNPLGDLDQYDDEADEQEDEQNTTEEEKETISSDEQNNNLDK